MTEPVNGLRANRLRLALEATVVGAITLPALFGGGVHQPVAALTAILCAAAFALFLATALKEQLKMSVPNTAILLAVMAGAALFQALPIGPSLVGITGGTSNLLTSEALDKAGITGAWRSLSIEPIGSILRASWMILAAGFVVAGNLVAKSSKKTRLILTSIALAGVVQFCIAVANTFNNINVLADLLPYHTRLSEGFHTSLVNNNHSAALFNLSAFAALALGLRTQDRLKKWLWFGVSALTAFGTVLTWSRGGTLTLLAIMLPLVVHLNVRERLALSAKRTKILAVSGLVLIGLATLVVSEQTLNTFSSKSLAYESWESKRSVWQDAVCLTMENPVAGTGSGSFGTAVAHCRSIHSEKRADFAENIVLQTFADWGIPVGILFLGGGLLLLGRLLMRNSHRPHKTAIWAGVLCVILQNLADFGLFIPGIGLPFLGFVFILSCRGKRSDSVSLKRAWATPVMAFVVGAALISGLSLARYSVEAAEAAANRSVKDRDAENAPASIVSDIKRHPGNSFLYTLAAVSADARHKDPALSLKLVEASLILNPDGFTAGIIKARLLATMGNYAGASETLLGLFKKHPDREGAIFRVILLSGIPDAELAGRAAVNDDFLNRYCLFMDRNHLPARSFKLLAAAAEFKKDDLNLQNEIGERLLDLGSLDRADAIAARLVASDPESADGWVLSGKVLAARNRLFEAEALYMEALRIDADNITARFGLLKILMLANRFGEFDELAQTTGILLGKERGSRADLLSLMAAKARRAYETGTAVDLLNKAILLSPERPSLYVDLGDTLMLQRRKQEAVNAWKSALEIRPGYEPAKKRLDAHQSPATP